MNYRFLLIATMLAASIARAEPSAPEPAEILAKLHAGHPRVLATAQVFRSLSEQTARQPEVAKWAAAIRSSADGILAAPPSTYEIPDGKRLLFTSRRVLDRTLALGLTFRLSGDKRYAERLWQELDAAARFPDWNPRHFLDTAEMTAAFALAYDWLHNEWTPQQRTAIKAAIIEKGLNPSLNIYRKDRGWAAVEHNWNQVCNGGMALGALAIADEEPALAGEILAAAIRSVPRAMKHFAPDGAWGEGPSYWDYATKYNVLLLAGLDSALGTDFGLSSIDGFSRAGDFPIQMTGPLGRTFNYADAGDKAAGGAQLFWLATKYNTPAYAAWRIATVGDKPGTLDLLWGAAWLGKNQKLEALPLAKQFRGADVVVMRSAWDDPQATFVGFKGGDNRVNHGHLDLGSFVLDAMGQRWALDIGADDYNLPGYFGSKRWDFYRCRAEGQNTLVINPGSAPDQDVKATAKITRFQSWPEDAFAVTDLSAAYVHASAKVQRGIRLTGETVVVQDEVKAAKPVELWWFMHTEAEVIIEGPVATLKMGGKQLVARIVQPEGATFQVMDAEPFPSSPRLPRQQVKGTGSHHDSSQTRKLAIKLSDITDTTLTVQFTPADERPAAVAPLAEW